MINQKHEASKQKLLGDETFVYIYISQFEIRIHQDEVL